MKVYIAYLNENIKEMVTPFTYELIRDSDLNKPYAFIDDKTMMKKFREFHINKYFVYKTVEIEKEIYKNRYKGSSSELKYVNLPITVSNTVRTKKLPLTRNEISCIEYEYDVIKHLFMDSIIKIPYNIFNMYGCPLHDIGYEYDYYTLYGTDEMRDIVSYNASFSPRKSILQLFSDEKVSSFNVYVLFYREIIDAIKLHELI